MKLTGLKGLIEPSINIVSASLSGPPESERHTLAQQRQHFNKPFTITAVISVTDASTLNLNAVNPVKIRLFDETVDIVGTGSVIRSETSITQESGASPYVTLTIVVSQLNPESKPGVMPPPATSVVYPGGQIQMGSQPVIPLPPPIFHKQSKPKPTPKEQKPSFGESDRKLDL